MATRRRKFTIAVLVLVLAGTAIPSFVYFCPGSMEGFWWNHSMDCMCGTHSFLYFHDSKVIEYQEAHLPPTFVGTYRKIGWSTYEWQQPIGTNKTQRFVLHPGLFYTHFGQDGEHQGPWWVPLTTHFYRVRDDAKNQAVLDEAKGMKIRLYPK